MMTPRLAVFPLALSLLLPGCSVLSALEGEPNRDVFELRAPPGGGQCGRGRVAELVVETPKARGTLDTARIMVRPSALQTEYLPDAIWGDPVPVMLQGLLVEALQRYDVFTHVGREPLGLGGDYALISEIYDFNAEVGGDTDGKGALIRLSVDAQLVDELSATVIRRGNFRTTAQAASTRTADLVPAFDAAAQELIAQMTAWALGGVGANAERCR